MVERASAGSVDLYRVLGVAPRVDAAELARAYRRRLRELHPDTRARTDAAGRRVQIDRPDHDCDPRLELAAVQRAYQVLRDPGSRARYDAERQDRADVRHDAAAPDSETGTRFGSRRPIPVRAQPAPQPWLIGVGPVRIERLYRRPGIWPA